MKRSIATFVFSALALILLVACGSGSAPVPPGLHISDLAATDFAGNKVDLGDYYGKPVILDFWATWCGPCIQQRAVLHQLKDKYGDKIEIVAVTTDDRSETAAKYLEKNPSNHVELVATAALPDAVGGVRGIPTLVVFGSDGGATAKYIGGRSLSFWSGEMDRLLAE